MSLSSSLVADITQQKKSLNSTGCHLNTICLAESRIQPSLGFGQQGPDLLIKQDSGRLDSVTARPIDQNGKLSDISSVLVHISHAAHTSHTSTHAARGWGAILFWSLYHNRFTSCQQAAHAGSI